MSKIVDLDDLARRCGHADGKTFNRWLARMRGIALPEGRQGEVEAHLEHGRWLAHCPFCAGAELVSRESREFFCFSCGMQANGGKPMRVVFPRNRARIEAVLERREADNQHWHPGDTINDLVELEVEHGSLDGSENLDDWRVGDGGPAEHTHQG